MLGDDYTIGEGIFILTDDEKADLKLTKSEKDIVKPLFTTNELHKYYGNSTNENWIIYTDSSYKNPKKIALYPNVKKHIDRFKEIITSDFGPYGLHRSRDEDYFNGEKIVAVRKCFEPIFTYTNFDCYVSQTFNIIKSDRIDLVYLTGILNSKLIKFWLKNKGKMQGENYQIDQEPIMEIPIFYSPKEENAINEVKKKVQFILQKKSQNIEFDTTKTENEIDQLVYTIYEMSPDDIEAIINYFN